MKQVLIELKGEINSSTVVFGDIKTSLSVMDIPSEQKINKETLALSMLNQMNLIDIYKPMGQQKNQRDNPKFL